MDFCIEKRYSKKGMQILFKIQLKILPRSIVLVFVHIHSFLKAQSKCVVWARIGANCTIPNLDFTMMVIGKSQCSHGNSVITITIVRVTMETRGPSKHKKNYDTNIFI